MKIDKKNIIIGISSLVLGILLTLLIVYLTAPGIMLLEDQSVYNFDQSVERFKNKVKEMGWKIPMTHDMQKTMKKFNKDVRRVKIFELCHPGHAYKILSKDYERVVSSLMPCRVAIYEKSDGKVYVSRLNSGLMGKMMGGVIPKVMGIASKESEIMVNHILKK